MRLINDKKDGQVFTPEYIVNEMLDNISYTSDLILEKHIIDNSCGDGAFLIEIVKRYISFALTKKSKDDISKDLSTYIHGIDIDDKAIDKCIERLNNIIDEYELPDVTWDVKVGDTLSEYSYDGMMSYVVGNPPYIRIHDINENREQVKKFSFAKGGMIDLYLVFFEIGFRMLNETGVMTYITPSSWLSSVAGSTLREYIRNNKNMISLVDLGHFQVFEGFTTYTIISTFSKIVFSDSFDYYSFDANELKRKFEGRLKYDDSVIDGNFYLSNKKTLEDIRKIKTSGKSNIKVKNGFATLSDKSFIGKSIPDSNITIPVIKASTGKWTKCLFPYDKKGKPLPYDDIFSDDNVKKHYNTNKEAILKGKPEYDGWWLYGRTQALSDVWSNKVSINVLVRDFDDLKIEEVSAGKGVYSGLYILGVNVNDVKEILMTSEFIDYLKALKKYKSGGYYTFNSKDLEQFLFFNLTNKNKTI